MADFPKKYVKGDRERVAHNVRDEVKLQFEGYRVAKPEADKAPTETAVPELTEGQMSLLPEAKDAEVVDLTEDQSNTGGGEKSADARNARNKR
jgi:hypothetical protein